MSDHRRRRAATLVLLPAAMAAGTVLYALLSVLAPFIIRDLGISRAELGWIVAVFAAVSALISPRVGRITDRIGARRGMLAVFATTAAGFGLMALAPGLAAMAGAAVVISIGQALANPATNKMIAQEVTPGRQGIITGIKQSGVQAGAFVAGVAFPALAVAYGWRSVPMLVAAVIALAYVLAWATLPERDAGHASRGPVLEGLPPSAWWVAAYAFFMGAGGSPIFSFLPLYGVEAVGVSEQLAGFVVGFSALLGVAARIAWSVAADRRGEYAWPMVWLSGMAMVAGVATVAAQDLGVWMYWVAALLGYVSISAWNSVAMLSIIVEAGSRGAGRASGIVLLGFLLGLAVAPPIFGWSVDRLGTYRPGFAVVTVLFGCAFVTMLGWIRRRAVLGEAGVVA